MTQNQDNNPLYGVKLKDLVTEIVDHYGFEILAEQININCFKSNASITSSLKFLRKTQWARDKVEAFYLYKYKGLPKPNDDQFALPPRDREIEFDISKSSPATIGLGESEFHDDPESGPRPFNKKKSRRNVKPDSSVEKESADPWGKWREKNNDTDVD